MTNLPARGPSSRRTAKVLITGPSGAGTTTFISTLRGAASAATERGAAPQLRPAAHSDTATDVARLDVADDLSLVVYGTPAHDRFGFLVDLLAHGALGYVLLVDGSGPDRLADARGIRRRFEQAYRVPSVVAVTKLPGHVHGFEERVRDELELPTAVPVLSADTREPAEVRRAVVTLLTVALERAAARSAAVGAHVRLGDVG